MTNSSPLMIQLQAKAGLRGRWRMPLMLFWVSAFALAYTQSPLFFSNQNQYFVHGLAEGGFGFLNQDWLATTADPTPVFSAIIAFSYRYRGLWLAFAYF